MRRVGRTALWLKVSGALASFPGSAQDFRITLAKVNSSLCSTAPPSLHGFPLSSITLSLFLSPLSASPAETINSARYRQPLISDFSLSGFDCL